MPSHVLESYGCYAYSLPGMSPKSECWSLQQSPETVSENGFPEDWPCLLSENICVKRHFHPHMPNPLRYNVPHSVYSPNSSPCDCHLLVPPKECLARKLVQWWGKSAIKKWCQYPTERSLQNWNTRTPECQGKYTLNKIPHGIKK